VTNIFDLRMSRDNQGDPQQSNQQGNQQPRTGSQHHQSQNEQRSIYRQVVGEASLEEAIIFGLSAAIIVFGAIAGLSMIDPGEDQDEADEAPQLEEDPSWTEGRMWFFFSSHFVELSVEATGNSGQIVEQNYGLFEETDNAIPSIIYRLVPVFLLTGVGYLYTSGNVTPHARLQDGVRTGSLIMAGYLPAVVVIALFSKHATEIDRARVVYEIPLGSAVPIAGIVYPLVFGALGGYIYVRTK
jgi:hypothetical protein